MQKVSIHILAGLGLVAVISGGFAILYYTRPPVFRDRLIRKDGLLPRWGYPTMSRDQRGNLLYVDQKRNVLLAAMVRRDLDRREYFHYVDGSISASTSADTVRVRLSRVQGDIVLLNNLSNCVIVILPDASVQRMRLDDGQALLLFLRIQNQNGRAKCLLSGLEESAADPVLKAFVGKLASKDCASAADP